MGRILEKEIKKENTKFSFSWFLIYAKKSPKSHLIMKKKRACYQARHGGVPPIFDYHKRKAVIHWLYEFKF